MWQILKQWMRLPAGAAHAAAQAQAPLPLVQQQQMRLRLQALLEKPPSSLQTLSARITATSTDALIQSHPVVVVDLESTGLNPQRDAVLSIGGIRVDNQGIVLGQTFERVLNVQVALAGESQLFHGLTTADLAQGEDPRWALLELLEWGQGAVWLAWHAWFDQALLHNACQLWLGPVVGRSIAWKTLLPIHDLAHAMPALFPQHRALGADLDGWLQALGLGHTARHHAVADAMATAELALMAFKQAQQQGIRTWPQWVAAAAAYQAAHPRV